MMPCGNRRTVPQRLPPTKAFPILGENGFLLLQYVGDEPDTWYGEVTNTAYPFDVAPIRYVDVRDAAFFLGEDFIEVI